jgi:hypothetical protein
MSYELFLAQIILGNLGEIAAVETATFKSRFLAQSVIVNRISTGTTWLPSALQVGVCSGG